MAISTPWGTSQYSKKVAHGIQWYYTAGHGGVHVSPKKNLLIPEFMRHADGWYEEDCDWAIPALSFPAEFEAAHSGDILEQAKQTLKVWHPYAYEMLYNCVLMEGESYIKDKDMHAERNKHNYVVVSATVANDGNILCTATLGGQRTVEAFEEAKEFLVTPARYDSQRDQHGLVIDPEIDVEVGV